jgi:hypothetical protein
MACFVGGDYESAGDSEADGEPCESGERHAMHLLCVIPGEREGLFCAAIVWRQASEMRRIYYECACGCVRPFGEESGGCGVLSDGWLRLQC